MMMRSSRFLASRSNFFRRRTTPSASPHALCRYFSTTDPIVTDERESMSFDVLIVGGGVAGLSASIRLKQLCLKEGRDMEICVIEKGSEIGAHVLSGNVFDPRALEELGLDWRAELLRVQNSHATPVTEDRFLVLTPEGSHAVPNALLPSQLHNDGNYIISLGQMCRWLGVVAEDLGVEVYPGFAADEVLYDDGGGGGVLGVATKDVGIGKDGKPKDSYEQGMALLAKQTLFAEGARGSCSEELISKYELRSSCQPQTYGLGLKEVWQIPPEQLRPGFVQHSIGWPLQSTLLDKTFGGTFLYHQEPDFVLCGMVIGLDYANPYLNPYKEFQRWKTHPAIRDNFTNGTCISYGARVLNEGGFHSIPKLTFPGGMLIGCGAGFLNAVKIKGSHTAMKSGIVAAESIFEQTAAAVGTEEEELPPPQEVTAFETNMMSSWVQTELHEVRNVHSAFAKWGFLPGLAYSGLATHLFRGREPWTLTIDHTDAECTSTNAQEQVPITYPVPDNVLTFDLLTNLQRSGTYHDDDQPSHLKIKEDKANIPQSLSLQIYGAPEQRFCPAGVYEFIDKDDEGGKEFVINAQNCVHCKCCSIKMPQEYIKWTVPEGGGGPNYQVM